MPDAEEQAFAQALARDFCDATRLNRHPEWRHLMPLIQTDQAFDARKLDQLLRGAGGPGLACGLSSVEAVADSTLLEPAAETVLPQPEQPDHYIFERFAGPLPVPPLWLHRIRGGFLSYDLRRPAAPQFYVFDARGALLDRLFFGSEPFLDPALATLEQPLVFADDMFPGFNICHLLFDKLPRLLLARQQQAVSTVLLAHTSSYTKALMEALGCTLIALAALAPRGTLQLQDAVYFSNSFGRIPHPGRFGSPRYREAFQQLRGELHRELPRPAPSQPNQRLFLTRPPGTPRSIVNQAALKPLLERFGIESIDPGALPFAQQLQSFLTAETLIGVHGAGLSNMLWMPDGATVLELLPPLCASISYWGMAAPLQLNYHPLLCHDPELGAVPSRGRRHEVRHNRRQVEVPVDQLEQQLLQLLR